MTDRRPGGFLVGLIVSIVSAVAGLWLDDPLVPSLLFLPVLMLYLGWPLVSLIERRHAIPSWYAPVLALLLGLSITSVVLMMELLIAPGTGMVVPVSSSIAAALNAALFFMAFRSVGEKVPKPHGRVDRKRAAAASCFIVLLILVAYAVVQPFPSKPLTEFYLLNEDEDASDMPYRMTVGESVNLTVGLANHEGRTVQYHVQVWLAKLGSATNPNSTEAMYYLDTITVVLEHAPMPLSGQWIPQHEFDYSFNTTMDGAYRLWFFLFFNEIPSELQGLTPMTDYQGETTMGLIEQARERQLLSLGIQLDLALAGA